MHRGVRRQRRHHHRQRRAAGTPPSPRPRLFTTVGDLVRFADAVYGTDLLLDGATRSPFSDAVNTISGTDLGLGSPFDIRGHGGVAPGAQTIVAHDRTSRVSVVVWCNAYEPDGVGALPSVTAVRDAFSLAVGGGLD